MSDYKKSDTYLILKNYFTDGRIADAIRWYRKNKNDYTTDKYVSDERCLKWMLTEFETNPYSLSKLPYLTVDRIDKLVVYDLSDADPYHVSYDDPRRVDAILHQTLQNSLKNGRSILDYQTTLAKTMEILWDDTPDDVKSDKLMKSYRDELINSDAYEDIEFEYEGRTVSGIIDTNWLAKNYELSDMIIDRLNSSDKLVNNKKINQAIDQVERRESVGSTIFSYDDFQRQCIFDMLSKKLTLVCGYAGTGKSTLMKAFVEYLNMQGLIMVGCAIAGKACHNLRNVVEDSDVEVQTIASLIMKAEEIKAQYLVIDEISMVGEDDLYRLFRLCGPNTSIVMLGDKAQLPAVQTVGALTSLLNFAKNNDKFCYHELTKVYRQDASDLLTHATMIRNKQCPDLTQKTDSSVKYAHVDDKDKVLDVAMKAIDLYGIDDVTLITPTNALVSYFNNKLQSHLAKNKKSVQTKDRRFYLGDRVLLTENHYDVLEIRSYDTIDIFNGFVGKVVEVHDNFEYDIGNNPFDSEKSSHIVVEFNDGHGSRVSFYDLTRYEDIDLSYPDMSALSLGYALTVHKAQGSTLPYVIYYLDKSVAQTMLSRQLLYTALTRAKYKVLFLTNQKITRDLLRPYVNYSAYKRCNSYLGHLLDEEIEKRSSDDFEDEPEIDLIDLFDDLVLNLNN